jgi:hypothetical protein
MITLILRILSALALLGVALGIVPITNQEVWGLFLFVVSFLPLDRKSV